MFMRKNPIYVHAHRKSVAKATYFKKANVDIFYNYLTVFMDRPNFKPQDICNADEIDTTTVQKPRQSGDLLWCTSGNRN